MDFNGDKKNDLLCGDASGKVVVFINTGTADKPELAAGAPVLSDGKPIVCAKKTQDADPANLMGRYSKIHYGDWNGDGLKDLLVGQDGPGSGSRILVYLNAGTAQEPKLGTPQELKLPNPKMSRPSPYLVDWDGDGKTDLLCGTESSQVIFFRNIAADAQPSYAEGVPLKLQGFQKNYRCRIDVVDWNNDGKLDLLVGDYNSSVPRKSTGYVWLFLGK